jgi:hypothetical protein
MVFEKTLGNTFKFDYNHLEEQLTFRELIRLKLNPNTWSNFGIDLALGSVIDREASPYEHLFLPIYVYEQMKHTTLNGNPVVKNETVLLDIPEQEDRSLLFLTPLFWLSIVLALVCYITYTDYKNLRRNKWLDFGLFTITGLAGVLILFLWFATDHLATKANFNSLWAFAPNIVIAFIVIKKQIPSWIITYIIFLSILLGVTCILWIFKIQVFSILLIIVLLALAIRYLYLIYYLKSKQLAKKIKI